MKSTVGSRELKNRLGRYLDDHAALSRLATDGLVSPPGRSRSEIADPRPACLAGGSLSETVVAERKNRL